MWRDETYVDVCTNCTFFPVSEEEKGGIGSKTGG